MSSTTNSNNTSTSNHTATQHSQSNIPATNTEPHSGVSPNISEGNLDQEEYFDYALDQQASSTTVTPATPTGESQKLKINVKAKYEFKPHEITPTEFHRSESEVFREEVLFSSVDEE